MACPQPRRGTSVSGSASGVENGLGLTRTDATIAMDAVQILRAKVEPVAGKGHRLVHQESSRLGRSAVEPVAGKGHRQTPRALSQRAILAGHAGGPSSWRRTWPSSKRDGRRTSSRRARGLSQPAARSCRWMMTPRTPLGPYARGSSSYRICPLVSGPCVTAKVAMPRWLLILSRRSKEPAQLKGRPSRSQLRRCRQRLTCAGWPD